MLKKSIFASLSKTLVSPAAPAKAPMRRLSAMEVAAVAGGPEVDHDPLPGTLRVAPPPPPPPVV